LPGPSFHRRRTEAVMVYCSLSLIGKAALLKPLTVTTCQVQLFGFQRPDVRNQPMPAWHEGAQRTKASGTGILFFFILKPARPPAHQMVFLLLIPLGLPSGLACVGRMRNLPL